MQTASTKKKYRIEEYVSLQRANPIIQNYTKDTQILNCMCKSITPQGQQPEGLTCFKCKEFTHSCIISKPNRQNLYECASCLNKSLDPLYQIKKVLVQSYFKIYSIFGYSHSINFEFNLCHQDFSSIVQIRGIVPGNTGLCWPMQGGFCINDQKSNFHQLKPLLSNSNRKTRRQEYFHIPVDKLRLGKNFIRFKIPCLSKSKFLANYQCEEKKIYYFAINLVNKLTPGELQTQTFRERRTQKNQSLQILRLFNSDVQITQNKVCLMCPYSKDRIKVPIRGRYCQHFSCICLQTLIASHSNSRYWSCPICDHRINEPYVDVWIYNMLIDNQKGSQVMIKLDGTYEWVKEAEENAMDLDSDNQQQSPPYRQNVEKMDVQAPVQPVTKPQIKNDKKEAVIDIQDDVVEVVPPPNNQPQKVEPIKKPQKAQKANQETEVLLKQALIQTFNEQPQKKPTKGKDILAKFKERIIKQNPNTVIQNIIAGNTKNQSAPKLNTSSESRPSMRGNNLVPAQPKYERPREESRNMERSRSQISQPSFKKPILYDVRTMQARQIRAQDFKRLFSKGKASKYKKYAQVQELRRLFKQIL